MITEAINFLIAIGPLGWVFLVLPLVLFEFSRYTVLYFIAGIFMKPRRQSAKYFRPKYTVIIAGHNEATKVKDCVICLKEQSYPPSEILVVSDGSTDAMQQQIARLFERKLIQSAHHIDLRGGKSAALNLISRYAQTDFIVQVDCDTSFHRHAMREILQPFYSDEVGIVSGNVVPRNDQQNLLTGLQAIEYLVTITLGRQASDLLNQLSIASGAFSAYRKTALLDAMGLDAGSGEDLDITLKMRQRGWLVRFAADAICYTDVPDNVEHLLNQRLRWERDAIALRYRKYSDIINPRDRRFDPIELVHQVEFLLFNVLSVFVAPFYIMFIAIWFGEGTLTVLVASYIILFLHHILVFFIAIFNNPNIDFFKHLPLMPLYIFYDIGFLRNLRLWAYCDEWLFEGSNRTNFVPKKVMDYKKERQ